jgi:uncharacterized protein (DUF433 family)
MTETGYPHIVRDERGIVLIQGTTMKLEELVLPHRAYGWGPDELAKQFPYLTLGQIYSALAYYSDHQAEIDQEIERGYAEIQEIRRRTPVPPIVHRLRAVRALRAD